ncbi:MAG: bifunctional nuclease family protein [Armatimonadota bacterium]|nr:bifunctional nuclease family protein [Armatimonadota bacterium]MDR7519097.1 bifunctional nuclease family protein [Armatimonadota bacterium]MDR7548974.1 bifunctional nuclease family protein [Armatimonadota bacterium]
MKVRRVALDQQNNPVVLLVDEDETIALPIWIGQAEAMAIAMRLQGVQPPRPMTHDLLQTVLEQLSTAVTRVVVSDVRDATYYAEIHLARNGATLVIDSRPSDAIALALRAEAPIFVEDKVAAQGIALRRVGDGEERPGEAEDELDPQEFRKFLERVKPSDFKGTVH